MGAATGATQDPGAMGLDVWGIANVEVPSELAAALCCPLHPRGVAMGAPWSETSGLFVSACWEGWTKRPGHKADLREGGRGHRVGDAEQQPRLLLVVRVLHA